MNIPKNLITLPLDEVVGERKDTIVSRILPLLNNIFDANLLPEQKLDVPRKGLSKMIDVSAYIEKKMGPVLDKIEDYYQGLGFPQAMQVLNKEWIMNGPSWYQRFCRDTGFSSLLDVDTLSSVYSAKKNIMFRGLDPHKLFSLREAIEVGIINTFVSVSIGLGIIELGDIDIDLNIPLEDIEFLHERSKTHDDLSEAAYAELMTLLADIKNKKKQSLSYATKTFEYFAFSTEEKIAFLKSALQDFCGETLTLPSTDVPVAGMNQIKGSSLYYAGIYSTNGGLKNVNSKFIDPNKVYESKEVLELLILSELSICYSHVLVEGNTDMSVQNWIHHLSDFFSSDLYIKSEIGLM